MLWTVLLAAAVAQSDAASRLKLEWRAPESCSAMSDLTSVLEATVPADRTFRATVHIFEPEAEGGQWRAEVLTGSSGAPRQRVVEAADCARVSQAAMLVVTLAATQLANEADAQGPPVEFPPGPPEANTGDEERPPDEPPDASRKPSDNRFRLPVAIGIQPTAAVSAGVVPVLGVSVGGAVTVWLRALRLSLGASSWFGSGTPNHTRGAQFSTTSFVFKAAWLLKPWSRWQLGPSLGAEVMNMTARATGIALPEDRSASTVAILLGALVGFEVSKSMRAWLGLEWGIAALRPSFFVSTPSGDILVHDVSLAVGRVSVGFEFEVYSP